ncbi:hypothetical protein K1719_032634 [Acacia pycnantha]|nr:hypothetical protein K1719_032634 [Acacia pycnantha]
MQESCCSDLESQLTSFLPLCSFELSQICAGAVALTDCVFWLIRYPFLNDKAIPLDFVIKCANILVDASGSVKLVDFGLAKATKLNDIKSCKGTAFWMAPEV